MNDIFSENYNKLKEYAEVLANKHRFDKTGISSDIVQYAWLMFKKHENELIKKGFPISYLTCARFVRYSALRHFKPGSRRDDVVSASYEIYPGAYPQHLEGDLLPLTTYKQSDLIYDSIINQYNMLDSDILRRKMFLLRLQGYTYLEIAKKVKKNHHKVREEFNKIKLLIKPLLND